MHGTSHGNLALILPLGRLRSFLEESIILFPFKGGNDLLVEVMHSNYPYRTTRIFMWIQLQLISIL